MSGRTAEAGTVLNYHLLLEISTAPGIVQINDITSSPNGTSTTVVWYQPEQPNGVVTGYQIIYSVYNDSTMIKTSNISVGSTRKYTIQNLSKQSTTYAYILFVIQPSAPGVPYQVQVVAFNGVGRGRFYDYTIFFSKELDPLKPPEDIIILQLSQTSINVTWTPLSLFEARGFPMYTAVLYVGNLTVKQSSEVIETTDNFAVFKHLQAHIEYVVVVSVANNGSSAPLQSSLIVGQCL